MKKPWLSAILNFFFMGLGYVYNGKRMVPGVLLSLAAIGLTYLEQFHVFSDGSALRTHDSTAFAIMFTCVFLANTGLAIDAYRESTSINAQKT